MYCFSFFVSFAENEPTKALDAYLIIASGLSCSLIIILTIIGLIWRIRRNATLTHDSTSDQSNDSPNSSLNQVNSSAVQTISKRLSSTLKSDASTSNLFDSQFDAQINSDKLTFSTAPMPQLYDTNYADMLDL